MDRQTLLEHLRGMRDFERVQLKAAEAVVVSSEVAHPEPFPYPWSTAGWHRGRADLLERLLNLLEERK